MIIRLDPDSSATPAEQLVLAVISAIEAGEVDPGDKLPTIRSLAGDLSLAPGTVAKAYGELERDGWIRTQGRRGTTVADRTATPEDRRLADAAERLAALVANGGLAQADAHRALDLAVARLRRA